MDTLFQKVWNVFIYGLRCDQFFKDAATDILRFLKNSNVAPRDFVHHLTCQTTKSKEVSTLLGFCHYFDIGILGIKEKSCKYFEAAAEEGFALAQFFLQGLEFKGIGPEMNYFELAARNGEPLGELYLSFCFEGQAGYERNVNKAFYWVRRAAQHGDVCGQRCLADYYEGGRGTDTDMHEALQWYCKAFRNGSTLAKDALDQIFSQP